MNARATHRIGAAAVFVLALVLYVLAVSPTVSFWDPGERIAVSHGLQIPHPPGAPFYMLVGRAFSMFVPAEHAARAVNMISVRSLDGAFLRGDHLRLRVQEAVSRGTLGHDQARLS
jgi:hypothetical protein